MEIEEVTCANENCKRLFKRLKKRIGKARIRLKDIRPTQAKTCSRLCGKEFIYNKHHLHTKMKDGIIYNCKECS